MPNPAISAVMLPKRLGMMRFIKTVMSPVSMDGLAVDFAMGFAMKLRALKVLRGMLLSRTPNRYVLPTSSN